jgi:myosin-5
VQAKKFYYTQQGNAEQIENVNDSNVFKETLDAFKLLGISSADQTVIFSLLSAILHLGNVKIVNERTNESSSVAVIICFDIIIIY